jgi:FG-GAP-like repeat
MNKFIVPILLTLVLTACGGGGGGSSPSAPANAMSAVATISQTNTVYTEAVGDINNDGLEDVVISGWNRDLATAYVYLFTQNSDGTLSNQTSLLPNNVVAGSQRVLLADFDSDGHTDIFIPGFGDGNSITNQNSVMFWGTGSAFTRDDWQDHSTAHGACVGDLNNDGKPDMLIAGTGAWINAGNRTFNSVQMLQNNYFTACAIIKEASSNSIYLGNNIQANGARDNINVYDFNLNLLSVAHYQNNSAYDTIDVVAADLTASGHKGFVVSLNGINVPDPGPREVISYVSPNSYVLSSTLESKRNAYYARTLSIGGVDSVFFSGDAVNASLFKGTAKMYASAFTGMAPGNSFKPANIYQNASSGKLYMLQLIGNTFYTQELK